MTLEEGQILTGPQFSEPVRIENVRADGPGSWVLGVVGTKTERFRRVTLTEADLAQISIQSSTLAFNGDPNLLRLGLQAYALGIAFEFDPYFGLSISRVDPLPHQLEAVYDHLLKLAQVRFLLADDAGAGKTIMAGLLVRELKLRGLIERILVVCPANLAFQWQRELKEKFDEKFEVVKGGDLREQYGINQFLERSQVITSLDLAKRDDVLPGLRQVHWDLVIIDEAHRMSWSPPSRKTARYALGELLRDSTDHMLMLTATPHKGDPQNFTLFLQLLDPDVYADVTSIRQAMENRRAPFYLRRTKEAMVYFPERGADGEWVARKVFTKRIPHSVDFRIDGDEFELYAEVTRFIRRQSAAAAARGEEARARAVGFLMALYQRRLASSTYALHRSLENRVNQLTELLKKARDIAREAPAEIPTEEELEEMEEADRERWERVLEAITLAGNPEQVREEIAELERLAGMAQAVEETVSEVKLAKLHSLLESEGFFADPDQRLLIFTEFKDTLDYILSKLAIWGLKAGSIHGSMNIGARDIPGTRLYAEQRFKDGDIQVLVATEAAGEGINLQFCHFLINYDIPWNPNRLEQRMGRIHRYGQRHDCLIFNFVATNTVEGRVLERLLHKLQEIRDALDDDAVFNVVGEVMPAAQIERTLRDYYAGKLGEEDMEDRLLRGVDEKRFRDICQNALEGLASRKLNLEMLIERRARAQEHRVVPETIARFLAEAGSAATYCQVAVRASARMDAMIHDLLDYGRLGHMEVPLTNVSLGQVLESALSGLTFEIQRRQAVIERENEFPVARAYAKLLEGILTNILENALRFVSPGTTPRIRIYCEQNHEMLRLWIEDNGIGIDPLYHDRIFGMFEMLNPTENDPGTGMGLAIVKQGMRRMGGEVGVEAQLGKGSRFWLELPLASMHPDRNPVSNFFLEQSGRN